MDPAPGPPQDLSNTSNEQILGVDREPLERFLILIRDNYKKADKAHFFLQRRARTTNVYGLANLRDVLSHLAAMLDPRVSNKEAQIANAEEHLRRAIIEPYETAVNNFIEKFNDRYESYRERVLPIKASYPELAGAPTSESVDERINEIEELAQKGKSAKRLNFLQPEWEEGVEGFIAAYDLLSGLDRDLENYINVLSHIEGVADYETAEQNAQVTKTKLRRVTLLAIWTSGIGLLLLVALVLKLVGLF